MNLSRLTATERAAIDFLLELRAVYPGSNRTRDGEAITGGPTYRTLVVLKRRGLLEFRISKAGDVFAVPTAALLQVMTEQGSPR